MYDGRGLPTLRLRYAYATPMVRECFFLLILVYFADFVMLYNKKTNGTLFFQNKYILFSDLIR